MKTLYTECDVQEPNYSKLIEYAMETSDAFMLVYFSYGKQKKYSFGVKQIKKALRPYRIKRRYDTQWPSNISFDVRNTYVIEVYRSNMEALNFLRIPGSLFSWMHPSFPEDIAFFNNSKCWLLTSAHERYFRVYFRNQEDDEFIRPLLGKYEEETFGSMEDLYCEEY